MPNLLPANSKKNIKNEYRLRIAIFALVFTFAGILIGLAFLIPTYVLLSVSYDDLAKQKKEISASAVASGGDKYTNAFADTTAKAAILYQDKKSPSFLDLILKITTSSVPGIKLDSIEVTRGGTGLGSVALSGVSGTREALILFKNSLSAGQPFAQVNHSIADLVKARDVKFTLNITGPF